MVGNKEQQNAPSILVVDDNLEELNLLEQLLMQKGYKVRSAPNGKLALQAAKHDPPSLIILDILMPEMNGFDVCKQLKADDDLCDIPVIFISGLTDAKDIVEAFSLGGADYVTKPFKIEEVNARVRTHLKLRSQQKELEIQNNQLQENYQHLRKLEELRDNLVHMIVHDMRTPLTTISLSLELIKMLGPEKLTEQGAEDIDCALGSTNTLVEMVSGLLDISKMESGQMELNLSKVELGSVIDEVIQKLKPIQANWKVNVSRIESPVIVTCDSNLLYRIIMNILSNAFRLTVKDGCIHIMVTTNDNIVQVAIQDNGPGIPSEYHERIFEKFGQVESRTKRQQCSTGLGLTFCKLAVEAHGGEIGVISESGKGSTFWFELPKDGKPECGEIGEVDCLNE